MPQQGVNGYEKWIVRGTVTGMVMLCGYVALQFLAHEKLEGHPLIVKEFQHIAKHVDDLVTVVGDVVKQQTINNETLKYMNEKLDTL